jgi:hypothetical protein
MNSLITFNHQLAAVSHNMNGVSQLLKDLQRRQVQLEQSQKDLDGLILKLQSRLMETETTIEERVKLAVDNALKTILSVEARDKVHPPPPSLSTSHIPQDDGKSVAAYDDLDVSSLYMLETEQDGHADDDIIVNLEEKKQGRKPLGRKPKAK